MKKAVVFRHLTGTNSGRVDRYELDEGGSLAGEAGPSGARAITIGRDPASLLALDPERDDTVGRNHAIVRWNLANPPAFTLTDLGSINGTRLNGNPVKGTVELLPGDMIDIGHSASLDFELDPRPSRHLDRTRAFEPKNPLRVMATRQVIDVPATAMAAKVMDTSSTGDLKRFISVTSFSREMNTMRRYLAISAAAVLLAGAAGGAYLLHKTDNTSKIVASFSNPPAHDPTLTAQDISRRYRDSVVHITLGWRAYDPISGLPVFIKTLVVEKKRIICFVRLPDGHIVPWLTTDSANGQNFEIGTHGATASGFVISPDGMIMTNKHVAAAWQIKFGADIPFDAAIWVPAQKTIDTAWFKKWSKVEGSAISEVTRNWMDWSPGEQPAFLFDGEAPVPISDGPTQLEGRNDRLDIRFPEDTHAITGHLVQSAMDGDVALIKIDTVRPLKYINLDESRQAETGDNLRGAPVFVLGYPGFSIGTKVQFMSSEAGTLRTYVEEKPSPTITPGNISQLGSGVRNEGGKISVGDFGDVYQMTVPTGAGNSGGPVFDDHGRVIGIFTYGVSRETTTYAVPISYGLNLTANQRR